MEWQRTKIAYTSANDVPCSSAACKIMLHADQKATPNMPLSSLMKHFSRTTCNLKCNLTKSRWPPYYTLLSLPTSSPLFLFNFGDNDLDYTFI